jgi:hypothetical protein
MKATRSTKSGPERLGRVGSSFFGRLFRADHGLYSGIAPSPIGTPVSRARAVFRRRDRRRSRRSADAGQIVRGERKFCPHWCTNDGKWMAGDISAARQKHGL